MRLLFILPALVWAAPAAAHPGHLAGLVGHDHWVAGAAIGLAVVIGLLGALKGQKDQGKDETDEDDGETAEAAA